MPVFPELFQNYILNVALIGWASAQLIKTVLYLIVNRKFNAERLVGAGGMPSSHSAAVCALFIAVARQTGVQSPEFAMAFILAAIVMYDAMGVRRAAGEHAKVLNKIVFHFNNDEDDEFDLDDEKELKEFLGHTPLQVVCGAMLGILVAILIPVNFFG